MAVVREFRSLSTVFHPRHASAPDRAATVRRLVASVAVLVLVATACTGDDDASGATTSPTTQAEVAPTSIMPTPPTTVPAVTVASTAPVTTATPTTAPEPGSTTTSTVTGREEQEVVDSLIASWTAFGELLKDPFNDDRLALVVELERGDALEASLSVAEDFRLRNLRTVENSEIPSVIVPLLETVQIDDTGATIEYCWVNSDAVVETAGNPDGTDRLLEDGVSVSMDRESYELIDGAWRKVRGVVLEVFEGETSCDAVL